MNIKLLFCVPFLLLISNCKTQTSKTETSVTTNNIIAIGLNKQVKIPNSKISLQFKDIVEDSRCPVNVTCVWEGVAIIDIDAITDGQATNFKVATKDFLPKNAAKSFSFSGYKFTLTELKPQPGGKTETASVTLKYEKLDQK